MPLFKYHVVETWNSDKVYTLEAANEDAARALLYAIVDDHDPSIDELNYLGPTCYDADGEEFSLSDY